MLLSLPAQAQDHGPHGESGSSETHAIFSATGVGESMSRAGSGTTWLPEASPMEALHGRSGAWGLMFHGAVFPRVTAQDAFESGSRGETAFGAPNWAMGMAQRRLGSRGQLTAKAMVSLDPLTEGGDGYPLLFQSGETWKGERLVDRQHPHDLFSELSLTYAHQLFRGAGSAFVYFALPGEPATGPVAFMHRPSARFNPDSPLGHHWQDATHVAFGVATFGLSSRHVKLEQSFFTGKEPDEERLGFDRPTLDSWASRISYSPTPSWVLHLSRAHLKEPEALEPGVNQTRTTASLLYGSDVGRDGDVAVALVWGLNNPRAVGGAVDHHAGSQHAVLLEGALRSGPHAINGRVEYVQKSPAELALDPHEYGDDAFNILSATLGAGRELVSRGGFSAYLGAQGTLYRVPDALQNLYGVRPVSLQVFLRISPTRMGSGHHATDATNHHH